MFTKYGMHESLQHAWRQPPVRPERSRSMRPQRKRPVFKYAAPATLAFDPTTILATTILAVTTGAETVKGVVAGAEEPPSLLWLPPPSQLQQLCPLLVSCF